MLRSTIDPPCVSRAGGLCSLYAAQRRGLRPALRGEEAHAVCDIGDGIAVGVDFEFVKCLGGEWLGGGGPRRVQAGGWVYVHDEDRLAGVTWFGEGVKIGEIETGVPWGNPKLGPE